MAWPNFQLRSCHWVVKAFINGTERELCEFLLRSVPYRNLFRMDDCHIFREALAMRYPTLGHALWEPDPGGLYKSIEVGDVGFIREGYFCRLFNALRPGNHTSDSDPSPGPNYPPQLELRTPNHIRHSIDDRGDFCSKNISRASVPHELNIHAHSPDGHEHVTFSCSARQGALISLPFLAQREDTLARADFGKWIVKNIHDCIRVAEDFGWGVNSMEDIILVTGRHLARSWTNVTFGESRRNAKVSFGVRVSGVSGVSLQRRDVDGGELKLGPSGEDLPENQCIFVRGYRVVLIWNIWPRLRGMAGPSNEMHEPDPQSGTPFELVGVPANVDHYDPLRVLLMYLANQAPECNIALVHDDDLEFIDGAPLETLQPDALLEHFREKGPAIQKFQCKYLPGNKSMEGAEMARTTVATLSNVLLDEPDENWAISRLVTTPDAASNQNERHPEENDSPSPQLPASGAEDGASLIVRLRDAVKAVKEHKNRLLDLSQQCDSLLSTVREYSPRLAGTPAGTEADAIERTVERILKRVSGWAKLSDTAAFLRQKEIQAGIEECRHELKARSDQFMVASSIMNSVESQTRHMAQQRDYRELVDMIASFLEEVRKHGRLLASEAPPFATPPPQSQADEGKRTLPVVSPPLARPPLFKLANISGKVLKVREQAAIEGSLVSFYHGEWADDGERAALGRLRDQSLASQTCFKEQIEASLSLQHRNILRFFGHVTIEDIVYSVNPWMENGNIREYIRVNPGVDCMRLLGQVASGMVFLHERSIVHGDLCGKNVLINGDGKAVVCGFGLSECSNPALDLSRARWFAPERITFVGVALPSKEGDIWSFGSLCLEVFTGEDPYSPSGDIYAPVLLSRGVTPDHPGSKAVYLEPKVWELMQSCWKIDPSERPSMSTIQSRIRGMGFPGDSRQDSFEKLDPPLRTLVSRKSDPIVSAKAIDTTSWPVLPLVRISPGSPPLGTKGPDEPALALTHPIKTVGLQTETKAQREQFNRVSDPLVEVPADFNIPTPLSAPSQLLTAPGKQSQSRPYAAPSLSTHSLPPPSIQPGFRRQFSVDSSSSHNTSNTSESGPRLRRWWSFMIPKRSRTNPNSFRDVNENLSPSSARNDHTPPLRKKLPQADSASLPIPLPQSRKWGPVSPALKELLEKMESDSECLLRYAADGSVSAGNLEGLVSRVITATANSSQDRHLKDTFLTVYQIFTTSEHLFEILKRRFESVELIPPTAHIHSRYNTLLFIESWLKKGFQDEELKCSATIREFARDIRGSVTIEMKAQEIASLIDSPDYVLLRQPGLSARLQREPTERPQDMTPADLAATLTAVEGDRFKRMTYWDYVIFTRGQSNSRRIEIFNAVHDLITVWVKRTVLQSDDLGERMKKYEEWIHAAQACRTMNNFSSTAAIVVALTSSVITDLALTCESKDKPILHALARELAPTDGVYQNTLEQATTKELIPWLDPLLSSLNSTFARSDPIVEVDGHPLIDFKLCIKLAEQIDSLVRYSPPRVRPPPDVLSYVEFSLKSCVGDDVMRLLETRSARLVNEEQALLERREKMRLLRIAWSPYPRRK